MPRVPISHPLALARLRAARDPAGRVDVLAAAIGVATHARPTLDPVAIGSELDGFARDVRHIIQSDNAPADALRHVLFVRHGFYGNPAQYNDPQNSYIDGVLRRRTGLPILLSLVLVETARRSGLVAHGIALPGHFVAAVDPDGDATKRIYIDAFNRGAVLTAEGCRITAEAAGAAWHDEYLLSAAPEPWAMRILNNLRATYSQMGDPANTAAVLEQMLVLDPDQTQAARQLEAAYQMIDEHIARNN
jgi:regulator of sirC expression with transglutaminase-like and TPR domain